MTMTAPSPAALKAIIAVAVVLDLAVSATGCAGPAAAEGDSPQQFLAHYAARLAPSRASVPHAAKSARPAPGPGSRSPLDMAKGKVGPNARPVTRPASGLAVSLGD